MDQVTGCGIYRNIIGSNRSGGRMTVGTEQRISYQNTVITVMTGSRVMTGGRTVTGRCCYRVSRIMMDPGLAVGATRMTIQTGSDPAGH